MHSKLVKPMVWSRNEEAIMQGQGMVWSWFTQRVVHFNLKCFNSHSWVVMERSDQRSVGIYFKLRSPSGTEYLYSHIQAKGKVFWHGVAERKAGLLIYWFQAVGMPRIGTYSYGTS